MLHKLPQLETVIAPISADPVETIRYINKCIDECSCCNMTVDISTMNVLDACYVSTICSTKHFSKYPDGNISWVVSSNAVQEFSKSLDLGNSIYKVL